MCEQAHALTGKRRGMVMETFVLCKLCGSSHPERPAGPPEWSTGGQWGDQISQ
ncbi:hypothetical protein VAWG002_18320 [Aeromonas veronii]|nr:hypothetical protein VAWG002_18320 [Aeromonas veronii]